MATAFLVAILLLAPVGALCLPNAGAAAQAETQQPDGQDKDILERLEVREDGAVIFDGGVVTGEEAERLRLEHKVVSRRRFAAAWDPIVIYYRESELFSVASLEHLRSFARPQEVISGLATTPGAGTLVLALTGPDGSRIEVRHTLKGSPAAIASADDIAPDVWLRHPLYLSPNKRWLLVTAARDRDRTFPPWLSGESIEWRPDDADVYLVDATGTESPRLLLSSTVVTSCLWSPAGDRAVCTVDAGDGSLFLLVDAVAGTSRRIARGTGAAEWDPATETVRVLLDGGILVTYDLRTGEVEQDYAATPGGPSADEVRSAYGEVCARLIRRGDGDVIRISRGSGHVRLAEAPTGVERLLGWSAGGKLLAYLGGDGTIRLCSGAASLAEYEGLMRCAAALGVGQTIWDSFGFQTRSSPLQIAPDRLLLWGWGRTEDGPFLVYVAAGDQQQLAALRLSRATSLASLGLDVEGDLCRQLAQEMVQEEMAGFHDVLRRYVDDHEGKLPHASEGPELHAALAAYAHGSEGVWSGLPAGLRLLRPDASWSDLEAEAKTQPEAPVRIAELARESAGTCWLVVVYTGAAFEYPDGGSFQILDDVMVDTDGDGRADLSYYHGIPAAADD